jgi:hypothetical protein
MRNEIIGLWELVDEVPASGAPIEKQTCEFKKNGELIMTYYGLEKKSLILLTYEIQGDYLITDQPSHPDIQKSPFKLSKRALEIESDEGKAFYLKRSQVWKFFHTLKLKMK